MSNGQKSRRRQRRALQELIERHQRDVQARLRSLREAPSGDHVPVQDDEGSALDDVVDDVDVALVELSALSLEFIAEALRRLEEGRYGICAECDGAISPARLAALPFAIRCVECEAAREAPPPDRPPFAAASRPEANP